MPSRSVPAQTTPTRSNLWLVRCAGAWVLLGGFTKAFTGTPAELPAPILELSVDPLNVLAFAVLVEVVIGTVALAAPRIGWLPVAALLSSFATILILHIRSGAGTCGCFGGALPVPAWVILAIDGALLAGVIWTAVRARLWQWERAAFRAATIAILGGLAAGFALGWMADRRLASYRPAESRGASDGARGGGESPAPAAWRLPETFPDQVLLRPSQWIGKPLAETELGRWTDTSRFPPDATIVIYYLSCNHCAGHLRELAEKQAAAPDAAPPYVLVQLPTPSAYTGKLFVDRVPQAALHVELPSEVKTWIITPPWDVVIEKGVVTKATRVQWGGE